MVYWYVEHTEYAHTRGMHDYRKCQPGTCRWAGVSIDHLQWSTCRLVIYRRAYVTANLDRFERSLFQNELNSYE